MPRASLPKPKGEREIEVPDFKTVLRLVFTLSVMSAILAVTVAILNAFVSIPFADQLINAFIEAFKTGIIAIIGFLGGRGLSARSR